MDKIILLLYFIILIVIIILLLASCHEDNYCFYWTFEEDFHSQVFTCSLMSSCEKHAVPTYPVLTSSGDRSCVPESYRRRKCSPACNGDRPYCHGRCVFFGKACLFHPCSSVPFRSSSAESCTELAFSAEEDECQRACHYYGADRCQACIEQNLPNQCTELSGSSCWYCSSPIYEKSARCEILHQNASEVIECVKTKVQQIIEGCGACVCTLLCYWEPDGPQCRACLENGQAADMFINNDKCDQGWVYSKEDRKCFKGM